MRYYISSVRLAKAMDNLADKCAEKLALSYRQRALRVLICVTILGHNLAMCITSSKMYVLFVPAIRLQSLGPEEIIRQVCRDVYIQCIYKADLLNIWIQWSTYMIACFLCWISLSHFSETSDIRKSGLIETLGSYPTEPSFFLAQVGPWEGA